LLNMKIKRNFAIIVYSLLLFIVISIPAFAQTPWTGDGGKYIRVTVTEPLGKGLPPKEQLLLPLTQSAIIGVFQRFSAMTVMDQFNLESVIKRQQQAIAGHFSETDYIGIGSLTNARLVVFGSLTKTTTDYTLELSVMDVMTGQRKASYISKRVSLWALENLSAMRAACADLLVQLGVNLTSDTIKELKKAEDLTKIQAETTLAMGITAQRQGMAIEALFCYFQAVSLDPSMIGAIDRASVVSASISGENLDQIIQDRLLSPDEWRTIITTTRSFYEKHLPYELIYDTDINRGNITPEKKTTNLSTNIILVPTEAWKTINNLRQILTKARQQNEALNFDLNKIEPRKIVITIEIVNEINIVLAKASHTFTNPSETNQENAVLNFPNVKVDDITERLTARVVSINEISAQEAGETGYIRISSFAQIRAAEASAQ